MDESARLTTHACERRRPPDKGRPRRWTRTQSTPSMARSFQQSIKRAKEDVETSRTAFGKRGRDPRKEDYGLSRTSQVRSAPGLSLVGQADSEVQWPGAGFRASRKKRRRGKKNELDCEADKRRRDPCQKKLIGRPVKERQSWVVSSASEVTALPPVR